MASFSREKPQGRNRQSTWQRWLPVVAGLVLLGFFGSIYWSSSSYSNSAIIAAYFKTSTPTSDISIIDQTPETNVKYLEHQFFLAENHFRNNDFTNAIEVYEFVLKNKNNTAYQKENIDFVAAEWNLMLLYLGKGERVQAMEGLEKIAAADFPEKYKMDAMVLKNKLNSFWYGWAN